MPALRRAARRLDDLHAHAALGHHLGHGQRNEGTAEADHRRHDQQRLQVQVNVVFRQDAFQPQHLENNTDQDQHGGVGRQEKHYAHHGFGTFDKNSDFSIDGVW